MDVGECIELESLKGLPVSLGELVADGTGIQRLDEIKNKRGTLKKLDVRNCKALKSLEGTGLNTLEELLASGTDISELQPIKGSTIKKLMPRPRKGFTKSTNFFVDHRKAKADKKQVKSCPLILHRNA